MIPRPALLSCITIPTGGWTFKFYMSAAAEYDTAVSVTLAAGDYFLSGDNQSDDLLFELQTKAQAGIVAAGGGFATLHYIYACLSQHSGFDSSAKITFNGFTGHPGNHIKIAWTECSAGLVAALGYDATADDTSLGTDTGTYFNADYHNGYAWLSDAAGQLEEYSICDVNEVAAMQNVGFSDGAVKTVMLGDKYRNSLKLSWLQRSSMYSGGVDYGTLPAYPLERNKALECWWREARQGKRFRVYEQKQYYQLNAPEVVTRTADGATTLTDSSKAWSTNRWAGCVLRIKNGKYRSGVGVMAVSQEFYISSNTATVLTVSNAPTDGQDLYVSTEEYEIWEHTYRTYVADLEAMNAFAPIPMARDLDYYGISIPLLRYVA